MRAQRLANLKKMKKTLWEELEKDKILEEREGL